MIQNKLNKNKMQHSKINYKNLLDNLNDIYYRLNKEGIITDINPIVEKISGHSPKSLIGRHVSEVFKNQDDRYSFINAIKKKGVVKNYELIFPSKDGIDLFVSANSFILKDEDGNPIGIEGILRDLTKKRNADKKL